jgi:pyrimidine deaminase RibD-like protein
MNDNDKAKFMREALNEGLKALPDCLPNPPVGCVIVNRGKIIARGYTNSPGNNHAEAMALDQLVGDLDDLALFVTLEPCSFHGRTPSCAKAIIDKRIKWVYVGMIDPHPKNNGKGVQMMQKNGIKVEVGILKEDAERALNDYLEK